MHRATRDRLLLSSPLQRPTLGKLVKPSCLATGRLEHLLDGLVDALNDAVGEGDRALQPLGWLGSGIKRLRQ